MAGYHRSFGYSPCQSTDLTNGLCGKPVYPEHVRIGAALALADRLHGPVRQLTRSQLRTIIFEYVEVFYSREGHQANLGHLTPAEYYATARVA